MASSALFTLFGAAVGACASLGSTWLSQRKLDQRQIRDDETVAIDLLVGKMWEVQVHTRRLPKGHGAIEAWQNNDSEAWDLGLRDLLGPAAIHVEAIRDSAIRSQIAELISLIGAWREPLRHFRKHPAVLVTPLAEHATKVLGAYRRREPTPTEPQALGDAREAWAMSEDEWQMQIEEEKSEQARRTAELRQGTSES